VLVTVVHCVLCSHLCVFPVSPQEILLPPRFRALSPSSLSGHCLPVLCHSCAGRTTPHCRQAGSPAWTPPPFAGTQDLRCMFPVYATVMWMCRKEDYERSDQLTVVGAVCEYGSTAAGQDGDLQQSCKSDPVPNDKGHSR
jgi:hypothetical protein